MRTIRLTIQCIRDHDHSKLLKFHPDDATTMDDALHTVGIVAEILTGTSPLYVNKPGPKSPIGKCATCSGQLEYNLEVVEENAKL